MHEVKQVTQFNSAYIGKKFVQFHTSVGGNEDVLGFHVSVDNPVRVQILECLNLREW